MIHKRPIFNIPSLKKQNTSKGRLKRILGVVWMAFKRTSMVLGGFMLISAFIGLLGTIFYTPAKAPPLPKEMVLFLNIDSGLTERPEPVNLLTNPFELPSPTIHNIIDSLEEATDDPRVKGLYTRLEGGPFALAHIQELRAAIKKFKEAGKFAYVYAPTYGGAGSGLGAYYLASAFDQIWLQPMGTLSITGINAEVPFIKGALDKLGITPQFVQRKKYKTAYESLTRESISPANKETVQALLKNVKTQILGDIPDERGFSAKRFDRFIDQGLFTAPEALDAGLITHMDYADMLADNIREDITGDRESDTRLFVPLMSYAHAPKRVSPSLEPKSDVALIYAVGPIMPSATNAQISPNLLMGQHIAAADEIAPAIMEATEDEQIKAIVLRVDSPGGSPTASESILRALRNAKDKGKYIVISMGPAAASGGYWIAAYADYIFASPTTLTGSIGVVGGKVALDQLWGKMGIRFDQVSWGKNAALWSPNTPFSESELTRINALMDHTYISFTARVAEGRKIDPAQIEKIAQGRVWPGEKALEIGLIDELGGLSAALDHTAQKLEQDDKKGLNIITLPRPQTPFEQLLELLGQQGMVKMSLDYISAPIRELLSVMSSDEMVKTYEPLRL